MASTFPIGQKTCGWMARQPYNPAAARGSERDGRTPKVGPDPSLAVPERLIVSLLCLADCSPQPGRVPHVCDPSGHKLQRLRLGWLYLRGKHEDNTSAIG